MAIAVLSQLALILQGDFLHPSRWLLDPHGFSVIVSTALSLFSGVLLAVAIISSFGRSEANSRGQS